MGKFDESRKLSNGKMMEYLKVYSLDASFDKPEDVPADIRENKRYQDATGYTISEVAAQLQKDYGKIDILVHSLANGPEVKKPLLETSRSGYLALTYMASEKAVPGYGGGMSSAKAALESDTKMLAWEAGRKWGIRVNTISAGPLRSRAARAIGFIDSMIAYSKANAPLSKDLEAEEVGYAAAFLATATGVTATTLYVDNGMHAMGIAMDSPAHDLKRQRNDKKNDGNDIFSHR
jgi:enoyl-[acyl-carrier protein] reductase I